MSSKHVSPIQVYIAEDNPILLQGLERALTANGYGVQTAPDGASLLSLLASGPPPDILLLDLMMPGMSGLEVLEAVRTDPQTSDLPVMLITAAVDELVSGPALEGGQVEVLVKPFRLNDLLSRIQTHVGARRARLRASLPNV